VIPQICARLSTALASFEICEGNRDDGNSVDGDRDNDKRGGRRVYHPRRDEDTEQPAVHHAQIAVPTVPFSLISSVHAIGAFPPKQTQLMQVIWLHVSQSVDQVVSKLNRIVCEELVALGLLGRGALKSFTAHITLGELKSNLFFFVIFFIFLSFHNTITFTNL
jgi:hypothetical protein